MEMPAFAERSDGERVKGRDRQFARPAPHQVAAWRAMSPAERLDAAFQARHFGAKV